MVALSKRFKASEAKKNAEALKNKKKEIRNNNKQISNFIKPGLKGKSIIPQSKKKK